VDTCTIDRERLDYARILLATSSLNIINTKTDILVEDVLVNIKIVEEWGCSIGEDVCLFEDDPVSDESEELENQCDHALNNDVDILVNEIAQDLNQQEHGQDINSEAHIIQHVEDKMRPHTESIISSPFKVVVMHSTPGSLGSKLDNKEIDKCWKERCK